jgi:hypothetical protein
VDGRIFFFFILSSLLVLTTVICIHYSKTVIYIHTSPTTNFLDYNGDFSEITRKIVSYPLAIKSTRENDVIHVHPRNCIYIVSTHWKLNAKFSNQPQCKLIRSLLKYSDYKVHRHLGAADKKHKMQNVFAKVWYYLT